MRLYSEDNKELELKEDIDDGIEYDPEKDKKILSEDEVIEEGDLDDGYVEESDDADDEDDSLDDGKDELFDDLDDEDDGMLFDNDLAEDNLENDNDEED